MQKILMNLLLIPTIIGLALFTILGFGFDMFFSGPFQPGVSKGSDPHIGILTGLLLVGAILLYKKWHTKIDEEKTIVFATKPWPSLATRNYPLQSSIALQ